ncbi:MAG: CHAD domain-containing protein [Acidobacteriota bacterium]
MDHRAALLLLLRQRLTTLVDAMPAAQAGDTRSVHQARVASRRLRGALPVLRASVDSAVVERVRRQLRTMTRALGPVRELDVALAHLDELAPRHIVPPRALARVRQRIVRERLESRRRMLAVISPLAVDRLSDRLTQVGSGRETTSAASTLDEAARQVDRRARALAAAVARAGALYLPDRLHAVRVAAKKLRYTMEVRRELTRSHATARITQLKRLQDLLGRMHDFEMLIDRTRQVQADWATADRRFAGELDGLVRTLERECRQMHATYVGRRRSIERLCAVLTAPDDLPRPKVA